jgi:hypothetical protein
MMIFFKKNKEKHEYQGLETFSQTWKMKREKLFDIDLCVHVKRTSVYDHARNYIC